MPIPVQLSGSRTNDEKSFQLPFFHDDGTGDEVAVVKIQHVVDANKLAFLPMDQKQNMKNRRKSTSQMQK